MQKKYLAMFAVVIPMSAMSQNYYYNYDASGNVTKRNLRFYHHEMQDSLYKDLKIEYNPSVSKAVITVVNSKDANELVNVSLYNANTNTLVEQQTFTGDTGEIDFTSKNNGIYIITAKDQEIVVSTKIQK